MITSSPCVRSIKSMVSSRLELRRSAAVETHKKRVLKKLTCSYPRAKRPGYKASVGLYLREDNTDKSTVRSQFVDY